MFTIKGEDHLLFSNITAKIMTFLSHLSLLRIILCYFPFLKRDLMPNFPNSILASKLLNIHPNYNYDKCYIFIASIYSAVYYRDYPLST